MTVASTALNGGIVNTDVPWIIDPLTGKVIGQALDGSFQGSVIGAGRTAVSIYPGAQGALNSFAAQSSVAAATTLNLGSTTFLDCAAGTIVCTLPTVIPAGQAGMVIVARVDSVANNAASVTFVALNGQQIADTGVKMANGQVFMWVFSGTYWKKVN